MATQLTEIGRAQEIVAEATAPLEPEIVPLAAASGRFLAEPIDSEERVPGSDNSAMDGYAVRATDVGEPTNLKVVGESRAGHPSGCELDAGEAIAISTGAVIPAGADAVVRVEDTDGGSEQVRINVPVPVNTNIRGAGEDIEVGDRLLAAGQRLGPAEIGVLTSVGASQVRCHRRPLVKVLATGDELVGADDDLFEGAVRNSNAATILALARAAGAEVEIVDRVGDQLDATEVAISGGLRADVLVICGGVSVGHHDHVKDALAALGVQQGFWGVSLKPGKPTYFGASKQALVFGLPGNPVSAFVTFELFASPALVALQGGNPAATKIRARLAAAYEKPTDRAHAVPCRLVIDEGGWRAELIERRGSHVLTSMLGVDGLAMFATEVDRAEAGESVEVQLLAGS